MGKMLLPWFLVGVLAMGGVYSYHGPLLEELEECPSFEDQGGPSNGNDVSTEPPYAMTISDVENGYIANGTYNLRIKANNPFRYFKRFIVAFENSDKTCEDVTLVPLSGNIKYLNGCKGVMVSDRPVKTTKLVFQWKAPSCGCPVFRAKVFEGSAKQATNLTPVKVCPDDMLDLDEYLNDILNDISPEVNEDDPDDLATSPAEEEYSCEEFADDNIIDSPHQDNAVLYPQGLCKEFTISHGSGMGPVKRRRWGRCCNKTGAGVQRCISKTVPPRERIDLRIRSVCRAIDLNPVASASFNISRCCNLRWASRRAHCFRQAKFQNIDDYCDGQIQIPFSFQKSESLLSSAGLSPCCSTKGRRRYPCFNEMYGRSRKNNRHEVLTKNAAKRLCANIEEKAVRLSGLQYCCNKLNIHDKVTCIGKLIRADFDAKCESSRNGKYDLFEVVRSESVDEAWRDCCLKDTGEVMYWCLARKHRDMRIIVSATRSSNTQSNDNLSVSGEVLEVFSGDSAPEMFSGEMPPETHSVEFGPDPFVGKSTDLLHYSPTNHINIEQGNDETACQQKMTRRLQRKLSVLNRICQKTQSRSGGRPGLKDMRRCCVEKPERRLACLSLQEEEGFFEICRGEITPLSRRLGVDHNSPCCQKVYEERTCCFEDHSSSKQKYLGRQPPLLVDLFRLQSDPRGKREINRMDTLCQDVGVMSKRAMTGRHNIFKCCRNEGNKKYLCLLQVFRTYTDKACSGKEMPITYEIGNFGEIPTSLPKDVLSPSHTCCHLEDTERYQCVFNLKEDNDKFEDKNGDKDFVESDNNGRMKRSAGWWTSGFVETKDSNAGDGIHRRRRMEGKMKLLRGLWNDHQIGNLCIRIVDKGAIGAFGNYREAGNENMDHSEGLVGELQDDVSNGDHVLIIESLRECCVIGDNRGRMRCVRRVRRSVADQTCAEIAMQGRSVLRSNVLFPKSCCDVMGRERYRCVSQQPRLEHRKKDVTNSKRGLFGSFEHHDSIEGESLSNTGPNHNFVQ